MLLGFSGIALMAAGVVLLAKARRMSDPWRTYRWLTPRPDTPSGLDPLPDEPWVQWRDPKAIEAEITEIEREGRHTSVLASRYSRVVPPELDAPLAPDPSAPTEPEPPAGADPNPTVPVELVATEPPSGADNPADSRPAPRGNGTGHPERIPTCWKCGLHIVPGTECNRRSGRWSQWIGGPDDWGAGPAANGTANLEHRDCDPHALVDEFSDYIDELRIADLSRRAAIRNEILPTLERLDELVPPQETRS